MSLYTRI